MRLKLKVEKLPGSYEVHLLLAEPGFRLYPGEAIEADIPVPFEDGMEVWGKVTYDPARAGFGQPRLACQVSMLLPDGSEAPLDGTNFPGANPEDN